MCKYTPPSGEPVRQGWPQKICRLLEFYIQPYHVSHTLKTNTYAA